MNRRYSISSFTLASLLAIFGTGLFSPAYANNLENKQQANQQQSKQDTTNGDSPVNAGLSGSQRPSADPLSLLQNSQIKKELNLTDEQASKIKQIETNFRVELSKTIASVQWSQLPADQKQAKMQEISGQIDKQVADARTKVGQVLTPDQLNRFKQISLQIFGWGTLTYSDFVDPLKLTKEQQDKLGTLREQMLKNMRASWQIPPGGNSPDQKKVIASNRKRMEQIIKESNQQSLAVLTPEQQKTLETLKGKEFKLDPSTLQPAQ